MHSEIFPIFGGQAFPFSIGLTVIIGKNGVRKSHMFKLTYTMITR
jgi:chromosome segregation ATPase